MIATFSEIQTEVLSALGIQSISDATASQLTSIKLRINQVQDQIFFHKAWEWRKGDFSVTTTAPYETGTLSWTKGSRTITGSGTTWIDAHKVGFLQINGQQYKIDRVASTTSIILQSGIDQTSGSGVTYKILFPNYAIHSMFTTLTSIIWNGKELLASPRSGVELAISDQIPTEAYAGTTVRETYYSTGTVSITSGSASVTGTTTTWTSAMDGMRFQVDGDSEVYTVREFISTTSLTLDRPYAGTTVSGGTYKINPVGTPLLTFNPMPKDYYTYKVEGLIRPNKLIANNDISLIPDHEALIRGAIWLAKIDFEDQNPVRIQQAEQDFIRSMKQLEDTYKVLSVPKWVSEGMIESRKLGRYGRAFNPLER